MPYAHCVISDMSSPDIQDLGISGRGETLQSYAESQVSSLNACHESVQYESGY